MQQKKVIIDRKPPIPIPEDDGIFYQVEPINYMPNGSVKRIRLDDNYKYCTGIAILADNGLNSGGIFGIKKNGKFIFDKLPFFHFYSQTVDNVNGTFFNVNFKAAGDLIEFYYEDINNGNSGDIYLIFRLENKKTEFKNKNYDINVLNLNLGLNTGRFIFAYNKRIKKIAFYKVGGTGGVEGFTVRDSSRFYFKDMLWSFVSRLNLSDVNKRFMIFDASTDNLMYEFNVMGAGGVDIFVVFEYED
ncbi:MAG: hypothetical protein L3J56_04205 [Bacteroidales bacterium]|nr:hypothetical protein [Bacteroidales bacterium]